MRKWHIVAVVVLLLLAVSVPVVSAWGEPGCPTCIITGQCRDVGGLRVCPSVCVFQ